MRYISGTCVKIKTVTCFSFYKVQIWVSSVANEAFQSIQHRYPPTTIHGGITSMTVLVPEPILQVMAPGLIEDFHASHRLKKTNMKATYEPVRDYYVASGLMMMSLLSDSVRYSSQPQRQRLRVAWCS